MLFIAEPLQNMKGPTWTMRHPPSAQDPPDQSDDVLWTCLELDLIFLQLGCQAPAEVGCRGQVLGLQQVEGGFQFLVSPSFL